MCNHSVSVNIWPCYVIKLAILQITCQLGKPFKLMCKIPLLARALGLCSRQAKRARDDRVSCIELARALSLMAVWPSACYDSVSCIHYKMYHF